MPNKMTAAEAAEVIEETLSYIPDGFDTDKSALGLAASALRRIAAGEYKQVVYCDDCALLDRSPCPARDPETGETRNCAGYCGAGARMDGKDDSHLKVADTGQHENGK